MEIFKYHREIVRQKISSFIDGHEWEGTHIELKLDFELTDNDFSELIKDILAFANTPRVDYAYIIFGVGKQPYSIIGSKSYLPSAKLFEVIEKHTNIPSTEIVVDCEFKIDDKSVPYIVIPQLYAGPYYLKRNLRSSSLSVNRRYIRYGNSSIEANDRDKERMKKWDEWAIDTIYPANLQELIECLIKPNFPSYHNLSIAEKYVRFVCKEEFEDNISKFYRNVLVHAYAGVRPADKNCIDFIKEDRFSGTDKWIVAADFTSDLLELASEENIRCTKIKDVFYRNDPYAKYCEAYLKLFDETCSKFGITRVIDLDFKKDGERYHSIIYFLDKMIRNNYNSKTIVTGDYGTGKSITAEYLVVAQII
jgi:hypothetical protein